VVLACDRRRRSNTMVLRARVCAVYVRSSVCVCVCVV